MEFEPTRLPDVVLIKPQVFGDARGFFFESLARAQFAAAGIDADVSCRTTTAIPCGTRCAACIIRSSSRRASWCGWCAGAVFDVAVDIRRSSPTFGQWVGVVLSDGNHHMLWVPPGFAHGYLALERRDRFSLQVHRLLRARARARDPLERSTRSGCTGRCRLAAQPILSAKDAAAPALQDAETYSVRSCSPALRARCGTVPLLVGRACRCGVDSCRRRLHAAELDIGDASAVHAAASHAIGPSSSSTPPPTRRWTRPNPSRARSGYQCRRPRTPGRAAALTLPALPPAAYFDRLRVRWPSRPRPIARRCATHPLSVYGRTKLDGEQAALAAAAASAPRSCALPGCMPPRARTSC